MSIDDATSLAPSIVSRFDRLVRRDGGSVQLLETKGPLIRVGYRPGVASDCKEGVCILPEVELQTLMAEVLAVQAPHLHVRVERLEK